MHSLLVLTHSTFRYFVMIFLLVFIVRSFMGWINKTPYHRLDEKLGVWLFMVTHMQFVLGIALYFMSPSVIFSGASMKDATARYWLVEHSSMMIIAIVLITLARITTKKLTDSTAKYRKLFIYNSLAMLLIIAAIMQSGRGFFNLPSY